MKNILKFLAGYSLIITCASTVAYADIASDYCRSLNGLVREYYFKDQSLARHEVEFCWIGDGAVGTWTLYNLFHPASEEGTTLEGLLAFRKDNNLTKSALNSFFMNLRGDQIEAPAEGTATEDSNATSTTDASSSRSKSSPTSLVPAPTQPKLPVQLDPVIRNPSFVYCEQAGGRPFPLERAQVDRANGPIAAERSENPHAAVCFWPNSAIEIWTLFWGSAHSRTEALTETLIWKNSSTKSSSPTPVSSGMDQD